MGSRNTIFTCCVVIVLLLAVTSAVQAGMGPSFTYQGQLKEEGVPVNGIVYLDFTLWDSADGGTQIGGSFWTFAGTQATDGLFTVELEPKWFGPDAFNGSPRWLQIAVTDSIGENPVELSPRQSITAAPYALYAFDGIGGGGSSPWSQDDTIVYYNDGKVGIGTSTPSARLHIIEPWSFAVTGQCTGENTIGHLGSEYAGVHGEGYMGVYGESNDAGGIGVSGYAHAATGTGKGVSGECRSPDGAAVYGRSFAGTGDAIGVHGRTGSSSGIGVKGHADAPDGYGVFGSNTATDGSAVGVYGQTGTASGFGGYFVGRGYFSGDVGIGTASPASKLGVVGVIESLNGGFKFPDGTIQTTSAAGGSSPWSTDGYDIWYTSGNIGAGVFSPQSTLHVAGGNWDVASTEGDFKIGNSTYRLKMGVATVGGGAGHCRIFAGGPASKLTLGANGADMLTVTGTDVGIGTLYPSQELDVVGTVRMTGLQLDSPATSGYVLTCDADGNGTWQEATGGSGFTLPYDGSTSSSSAALKVTNSGTGISSHAISARINNASSHGDACAGYFNATGSNGYAIYAIADGTSVRAHCSSSSGTAFSGSSSGYGGYFSGSGTDCYGIKARAGALSGSDTIGGWFESSSSTGKGVYSTATGYYATGVKAEASGDEATALSAYASGTSGVALVAKNESSSQPALVAKNYVGGPLIQAKNASPSSGIVFEVANDGTTSVSVLHITGGADLAEKFEVSEHAEPGMVVEIDVDNPGKLRIARGAYNRRVAGVVSGANDLSVGMMLGKLPGDEDAMPIALSGRVWVYCDAAEAAIEPGDMLTTSDRPGYAMSVLDYDRAHGSVIGKAMTQLAQGETGMVLVLVNLQ